MKILMSAYSCDPHGISESYGGFKWLEMLLNKYEVILLTTIDNEKSIQKYYGTVPNNLTIVSFEDNQKVRRNKILEMLKVGYLLFNRNIYTYLINNPKVIQSVDLTFHRTPNSLRYFSNLYKFNKPFIIGPIGGGLQVPKELKNYFNAESFWFKLRKLDGILLKLPVYKKQFKKANTIIVSQPYVTDIIGKRYEDKIETILDVGINCDEYKKSITKTTDKTSLLYVGKLRRYKGAELLIKAFAKLDLSKLGNIQLDIVGNGEEDTLLQKLVDDLKLNEHITFHGFMDKENVMKMYDNADIFTFPTLKEGSGFVLLEAMAKSLPIITINNGGPKYLCPTEGAVKIEIESTEQIINDIYLAINTLLENPEKRKEMGNFNNQYCRNNFDWMAIEQRVHRLFDKIAGQLH